MMEISPKGKEKSSLFTSNHKNNGNGNDNDNGNMPWVEKYRPTALDDVVHHTDIITTLRRFLREGRLPHLLLYGPPGTGKTSTAMALAHDIFGPSRGGNVLELNASDERGINVVREQIKTFAATRTLSINGGGPSFKLILLDECDAMTSAAQNALRRVMEKYVKNVRFILICNYVGQIIPALQSRCTRFRFSPLPIVALRSRLDLVIMNESLSMTEPAKDAVIKLANGDMRRILNILQAASTACSGVISDDLIYSVTATPHPADLDRIFHTLLDQTDFTSAISTINQLKLSRGLALVDILLAMFDRVAEISIPDDMRIFLTRQLAEIEYRLSHGAMDAIQLSAIVGAFFASRTLLGKSL